MRINFANDGTEQPSKRRQDKCVDYYYADYKAGSDHGPPAVPLEGGCGRACRAA